ncbi:hypothetical protein MRX96_024588 [Rhipicephalus microplus]
MRTIKDVLMRFLGRSSLSYEELLTLLAEVEVIVNCHPLTQLCEDAENAEALTPSHFITGKRVVGLPASTSGTFPGSTAHELRRRVRYKDKLLHQLWTRWKKEHGLFLRSAHHCQLSPSSQLRIGDLAVFRDDNVPALQWKLGREFESFPDRDGLKRMILTLLLCVLVALTAQAMGPQEADKQLRGPAMFVCSTLCAGCGILPGAIIVDVHHGLLLPQGHSREELEPVIRDSLRILDHYLHETGGTNRPFRVKRTAAAKHLLTAKNIRSRVDKRRRANVKLPCRGKARAKRSTRYALNAFSINPKPANKSGGYYTLFARVSEAVLQDLMVHHPPVGESNLSRHPSIA